MTTMLDCINEQPRVCEQILADEATSFSEFDRLIEDRQVNRVLVLATGSSLNAVHAAERHLEVVGGIVTKVVEPFTYSEYESLDNDFDLVIAVSQRGTSSSTRSSFWTGPPASLTWTESGTGSSPPSSSAPPSPPSGWSPSWRTSCG